MLKKACKGGRRHAREVGGMGALTTCTGSRGRGRGRGRANSKTVGPCWLVGSEHVELQQAAHGSRARCERDPARVSFYLCNELELRQSFSSFVL